MKRIELFNDHFQNFKVSEYEAKIFLGFDRCRHCEVLEVLQIREKGRKDD